MRYCGHSSLCILHSALSIALTLAVAATAVAATYYASPTGTAAAACTEEDPGTIQAAVDKVADRTSWAAGDFVILLPGTYDYSDAGWSGQNCVSVSSGKRYLTIRSQSGDPADVTILGGGTAVPSRAFYNESAWIRFQGLTITNFHFTADGVAVCGKLQSVIVEDCVVAGNSGSPGAALKNLRQILGTVFIGNSSTGNGGAVVSTVSIISNCLFTANHSDGTGGACNSIAGAQMTGCVFSNNTAATGGAIYSFTGTASNCLFRANSANEYGAVFNGTYYDCRFEDNEATTGRYGAGGGAMLNGVYNCVFSGNHAATYYGALTVAKVVSGCLFTNNWAGADVGALGGGPTITNCLFVHNRAVTGSSGVLASGARTIYDSAFIENAATNGQGGVATGGRTAISKAVNCVFIGNKAAKQGLGVVDLQGCLVVSNETMTAVASDFGLTRYTTAVNTTFLDNRTAGSGVLSVASTNCLLNGNAPCDLSAEAVPYAHCLYGTAASDNLTLDGCVQTSNPRLNLGADPKSAWYAPRFKSPARDAGLAQAWAADALDLAGKPRLTGPIDIGCYECWAKSPATILMAQ